MHGNSNINVRLLSSDLMQIEFSRQIFEKNNHTKFHRNLSSGNRVVPCETMNVVTDTTKLKVASRNFANAPIQSWWRKILR